MPFNFDDAYNALGNDTCRYCVRCKRVSSARRVCVTISTLVGLISDLGARQARFLNPWYNKCKNEKIVRNQKMNIILNPWYIIV